MSYLDSLFDDDITGYVSEKTPYEEAADDFGKIKKSMDLGIMKVDAFAESVERELRMNYAQCELKVMKESGTDDDLAFLEDAAEEGALGKLKALIDKIIQMWKEFVSNLRNKVVTKIASKEARTTLTKAEKKIKLNPILARKKVEVLNIKTPLGIINSYKSKVDKITAKVVKGLTVEHARETLAQTKDSFREEFRPAVAGKAAVMILTVAAVVTALNKEIEKLPTFLTTTEKEHTAILERMKSSSSQETAAAATAATQACANFRTELAKEELNQHIDYVMSLMDGLKKNVMKAQGNTPMKGVKDIKESADFDFDGFDDDDSFEESSDNDFLTDLDDLFD